MTSYQTRLRQLLQSNSAVSQLLSDYETAVAAADRRDYEKASTVAAECHSRGLERFGEAHPISLLLHFFRSHLLAKAGKIDEAALQFSQVINASLFAILSEMPAGDEAAAELTALFFETCLSDSQFNQVLYRFDKDEENLKSISNVATSLINRNPKQAYFLSKGVFETRKHTKGDDNEDTLLAAHKFSTTLMALGQYQEAGLLFRQTFEQRSRRYGFGHVLTLRSAGAYANALYNTGFREEALVLQHCVFEKSREINGDAHPQTQLALNNLREMQKGA